MPLNLNIPLTTLSAADGPITAGPYTLHQSDTLLTLTIDRTVAGGFNSLDPSVSMNIEVDFSDDGGTTWFLLIAATITGGIILGPPKGNPVPTTTSSVSTGVDLHKNSMLRGTATVINGTVTIQGSFTVN